MHYEEKRGGANIPLSPEALLFDMDGVLVDSFDSWWKSFNEALRTRNKKEISKQEFREKYWGHELKYNLSQVGLNDIIDMFCKDIYNKYVEEVRLFSGVKEILEQLNRYPKAIITNTPFHCTHLILTKFDIDSYFVEVMTSDQIANGKPSPEIIFETCKRLRVDPQDVILIGDTTNDVKAGRTAGCITVGVKVDADYSITTISELLSIITLRS